MSTSPQPGRAWAARAGALAAWADSHLVNRRDCYGHYIAVARRADPDITAFTDKSGLNPAVLQRHFRGRSTGDLVGLHATARDDAGSCRSRWLALDIDRHRDETDPAATRRFAAALYDRLTALGFLALLCDSNGRGGFHLLVLFADPVPAAHAHRFGRWLVGGWRDASLDEEPEVFPKQEALPPGGYGNWLRLPGRHHTLDHWTRVWDGPGTRWLDGEDAVAAILGTAGTPADRIPAEALRGPRPQPPRGAAAPRRDPTGDAALARGALEAVRHLAGDYRSWLEVGMALTPLGHEGLSLWDEWSRSDAEKYQEGACERKWRSFRRAGAGTGAVTLGTLFHRARAAGWSPPPRANGRHDRNGASPHSRPVPAAGPEPGPGPAGGPPPPARTRGRLVRTVTEIEPQPVPWLWPGRIPKGFITVFAGNTSAGKSFVAFDLAARLSRGDAWPGPGGECAAPGRTLVISEDSDRFVISPRFRALNAVTDMIFVMTWEAMSRWSLGDTETLDAACAQSGEPDLIIVDPPTNFLVGRDAHKDSEVREVLMKLVQWLDTRPRSVSLILIMHVNKAVGKGLEAVHRLLGSVAWGTVSRVVHTFTRDPEDRTKCVFACPKVNIAALPESLGYRVVKAGTLATVEWLGVVDLDAEEAMNGEKRKPRGVVAVEWLAERFRERREWPSDELKRAALEAGLSKNALWSPEALALPIQKRKRTTADGESFWVWVAGEGWPPPPAPAADAEKTAGKLGMLGKLERNSLPANTNPTFPMADDRDQNRESWESCPGVNFPDEGVNFPDGRESSNPNPDPDLKSTFPTFPTFPLTRTREEQPDGGGAEGGGGKWTDPECEGMF